MMTLASFRAFSCGFVAAMALAPSLAGQVAGSRGDPRITIRNNVHLSVAHAKNPQGEITICAHPTDPNELLAGIQYETLDVAYPANNAYYVSHDGGKSWSVAFDEKHRVDPTCAFGPDGTMYALLMIGAGRGSRWHEMTLYSSKDKGETWSKASTEQKSPYWVDRAWLTTDLSNSKYRGSVYFAPIEYRLSSRDSAKLGPFKPKVVIYRSTDKGKTLQRSQSIISPYPATHPGQMGVLSDGTVVHAFVGLDGFLYVVTSSDGGRTITKPQIVGGTGKAAIQFNDSFPGIHYIPMVDVDRTNGPYKDRVYIAWTESGSGRNQVWFVHSTDRKARKWAGAHPIDEAISFDPSRPILGPNSATPAIAVNKNGIVGVLWADRRDTELPGYYPRFMASFDGGETWAPSVRITEEPSYLRNHGAWWRTRMESDDLTGEGTRPIALTLISPRKHRNAEPSHGFWGMTAAADGSFHPLWIDDRTGITQSWTATIDVKGAAYPITDVTDSVLVQFGANTYDSATANATVEVMIVNTSNRPLRGPFLIKVLDPGEILPPPSPKLIAAGYGPKRDNPMVVLNADNGLAAGGAYWEFPLADGSTELKPGEATPARRFELSAKGLETARREFKLSTRVFRIPPQSEREK
jgi:hypothetical protein